MRIPVAAALVLLVALGGCGGGDEPASSNAPTKDTSTRDHALKELTEKTKARADQLSAEHGKPAPQDLTSFRCARDAKGQWNAVAVVSNSAKKAQSYQITVHVGPAEGEESPARTQSVGRVNAGGSVTVRVLKVPAAAPDGPCQVQLLASPA
jgi:hypothetical protein